MEKQGVYMYHYSFVFPKQVKDKTLYHWRRSLGSKIDYLGWLNNNYIHLTNPFRIYHDQTRPSWLCRFNSKHPQQIEYLISDINKGRIHIEIRPDEDINRLLHSLIYVARTSVLHKISILAKLLLKDIPKKMQIFKRWLKWIKMTISIFSLELYTMLGCKLRNRDIRWWFLKYQLFVKGDRIFRNVNSRRDLIKKLC